MSKRKSPDDSRPKPKREETLFGRNYGKHEAIDQKNPRDGEKTPQSPPIAKRTDAEDYDGPSFRKTDRRREPPEADPTVPRRSE